MKKHPLSEFIDLLVDVAHQKAKNDFLDSSCSEPQSTHGTQVTCKTKPRSTTKFESVGKSRTTRDSLLKKWAAAGLKDTLLRCEVKPEVVYGNEKAVQPRVQA